MNKYSVFITNDATKKLKDRITTLITGSEELKFLVGFFYFSGIKELYEALKATPLAQTKILVGLNVDNYIHGLVEYGEPEKQLTNRQRFENFLASVSKSINSDDFDNQTFYEQIGFFIELIKQNKLIIRKTRDPNHSKLYIFKMNDQIKVFKPAFFITGSSNLTRAGLSGQDECNVEISDYGTAEAEKYFDDLWEDAIQITEHDEFRQKLIQIIEKGTLITDVTPFEAYALILKTYLDIQKQKQVKLSIVQLLEENGYVPYKYQLDAVAQALAVIESCGGVIVADVVGLGKSIIAGMIARSLGKRGIVICPPSLIGDENKKSGWQKYREDFKLHDWEIRSCGLENLDRTLEFIRENDEYEIVIIDEVHRFRNQDTEAYKKLSDICRNKIVIMLTATPFNNSPEDIFSLLKLFIVPGKSSITLKADLELRFRQYTGLFKDLSYIRKNHNSKDRDKRSRATVIYEALFASKTIDLKQVEGKIRQLAGEIRQVIEPVLIRRNRIDLKNDPIYSKEIYELPEVKDPIESFFALTQEQADFYDSVITEYFGAEGAFKGAMYKPYLYEAGIVEEDDSKVGGEENRERLIQKNLYDFMRRLVVKRFESSFGAFEQTIRNFRSITQTVQTFVTKTKEYILDRDLLEEICSKNDDEIQQRLSEYENELKEGHYPKSHKRYKLDEFKSKKKFLEHIQADIDLFTMILKELSALKLTSSDPKLECLKDKISEAMNAGKKPGKPQRKVVIFTEYADTAAYIQQFLNKELPGKVLTAKGFLANTTVSDVLENFDASYKNQSDVYQILVSTDKLAEGVNLNRAGAVINFDIPWNPTRVIQRVGRINRIGKMVFPELYIYNFFPTLKGAEFVQSRKIAEDKMFVIHNTLGEDAKIFEIDEEPTASNLYQKINQNPEKSEKENFQTTLRRLYAEIEQKYPAVIKRISELPPRVKTAKGYCQDNLIVFFRKGVGFFARGMMQDDDTIADILFEQTIELIQCAADEKKLPFSSGFWDNYQKIKDYKDTTKLPPGPLSLETRALNNIKALLANLPPELGEYTPFLNDLCEDIMDYKTLPDYTLRQLASLKASTENSKAIAKNKDELAALRKDIGSDYLQKIKERIGTMQSELIIAVENVREQ